MSETNLLIWLVKKKKKSWKKNMLYNIKILLIEWNWIVIARIKKKNLFIFCKSILNFEITKFWIPRWNYTIYFLLLYFLVKFLIKMNNNEWIIICTNLNIYKIFLLKNWNHQFFAFQKIWLSLIKRNITVFSTTNVMKWGTLKKKCLSSSQKGYWKTNIFHSINPSKPWVEYPFLTQH